MLFDIYIYIYYLYININTIDMYNIYYTYIRLDVVVDVASDEILLAYETLLSLYVGALLVFFEKSWVVYGVFM